MPGPWDATEVKTVEMLSGKVKLEIWDMPYATMSDVISDASSEQLIDRARIYKDAEAVFLVYDITQEDTFNSLPHIL